MVKLTVPLNQMFLNPDVHTRPLLQVNISIQFEVLFIKHKFITTVASGHLILSATDSTILERKPKSCEEIIPTEH